MQKLIITRTARLKSALAVVICHMAFVTEAVNWSFLLDISCVTLEQDYKRTLAF